MEQPAKDTYELVDGFFIFFVGVAENDNDTCFIRALYQLISKIWVQERSVQVLGMPVVSVRLARENARIAAERQMITCDSLSLLSTSFLLHVLGGCFTNDSLAAKSPRKN